MVKSYGYSYVKFDIKFGIMATAMVEFWDLEVNIYGWEGGVGGIRIAIPLSWQNLT